MFRKILCATDLNTSSSEAVKAAVQIAHQYNSKIIMLNVHGEFMTKEEMGMLRVSIDTMKLEFEKTALQAKNEMRKVIETLHALHMCINFIRFLFQHSLLFEGFSCNLFLHSFCINRFSTVLSKFLKIPKNP